MTLDTWLNHIEQLHSSEIELGLDRLMPVAERLGVTRLPGKVVTVAGTNGKGSTVALLEALARESGHDVACYTSPHIHRFNERVRFNGQAADDGQLCAAFERVEQARQDASLTYFEFTTLVALDCFRRAAPDIVILEVGLGGRLDAVNLIDADVAVVTSIGLDHTAWLGDTREAIAREKCGIARSGRPLIYGEADRPVTVDECCRARGATLLAAGQDFGVNHKGQLFWSSPDGAGGCPLGPTLLGPDNLACAVQSLALIGLLPDVSRIAAVAASTSLAGRCQAVEAQGVTWLFDVGHNREAIARLVDRLPSHPGRTRTLIGMLGDKPARETLALLAPFTSEWHLLSLPPPRGLAAAALRDCLPSGQGTAFCHDSASAAVAQLAASQRPGDRVLVLGSFLTVDQVASAQGWNLFECLGPDTGIPRAERTQ